MANFIAKWVDYKDPTAEINQLKTDVADLQEKYNNLPTEIGDVGTMKADITTLKGKFNAAKAGQYMESTDAAGNIKWARRELPKHTRSPGFVFADFVPCVGYSVAG